MENYLFEEDEHCFMVNGGDKRTTKWAYGVAALVFLAMGVAYTVLDFESLPVPPILWAVICVACIFFVYTWLSKGAKARYEVRINTNNSTIKAFDRKNNVAMWEDNFQPENVYRSNIQVLVSGQVYRYPVLAYGSEPKETIEDGVPYVDRILLGFGEEDQVEEMIKRLKG